MSLAITGSPGTGKHTAAGMVAGMTGLPIIDINAAARDAGLLEESGGTSDVDTAALGRALEGRIRGGECIVVGHLAPYVLADPQVRSVIVLRRNPYDLMDVYRQRGYPGAKAAENAASEILGVIAYDSAAKFGPKAVQIDTSSAGAGEVAARICAAADGPCGGDAVDWLGMVSGNGDLGRFFAD